MKSQCKYINLDKYLIYLNVKLLKLPIDKMDAELKKCNKGAIDVLTYANASDQLKETIGDFVTHLSMARVISTRKEKTEWYKEMHDLLNSIWKVRPDDKVSDLMTALHDALDSLSRFVRNKLETKEYLDRMDNILKDIWKLLYVSKGESNEYSSLPVDARLGKVNANLDQIETLANTISEMGPDANNSKRQRFMGNMLGCVQKTRDCLRAAGKSCVYDAKECILAMHGCICNGREYICEDKDDDTEDENEEDGTEDAENESTSTDDSEEETAA